MIAVVYPGDIIPIKNGSRQRVMDLIRTLHALGFKPDLYCDFSTGGRARNLAALASYVGTIRDIQTGFLRKKALKTLRSLRNSVAGLGAFRSPRDRYRQIAAATGRALAAAGTPYDLVICSYLWTLPPVRRPGTAYVLDTHDIHMYRDRDIYAKARLPGLARVLARREQRFETAILNAADAVWAISEADREILSALCPSRPVVALPPSLGWLDKPSAPAKPGAPRFGFFGSGMDSNRLSLEAILASAWPMVRQAEPEASLVIAGRISAKVPDSIPSVVKLGAVDDLNAFYDRIDVLLAPIFVMGGINFKIAEALCAGKIVLTNDLGRRSMPPSGLLLDIADLTGGQASICLDIIKTRLADRHLIEAERLKTLAYFQSTHRDGIRDTLRYFGLTAPQDHPR